MNIPSCSIFDLRFFKVDVFQNFLLQCSFRNKIQKMLIDVFLSTYYENSTVLNCFPKKIQRKYIFSNSLTHSEIYCSWNLISSFSESTENHSDPIFSNKHPLCGKKLGKIVENSKKKTRKKNYMKLMFVIKQSAIRTVSFTEISCYSVHLLSAKKLINLN